MNSKAIENTKTKDRDIYIPKGRRELNEKMKVSHDSSEKEKKESEKNPLGEIDDQAIKFGKLALNEKASDEEIASCSILVDGFPSSLPNLSRHQCIEKLIKRGANYRWINNDQCLVVFKSSSYAASVLSSSSSQSFQTTSLEEISEVEMKDTYMEVSRELYDLHKPTNDSRVASRIISSHLGIKVPVKATTAKTFPVVTAVKETKPVLDAWDDT